MLHPLLAATNIAEEFLQAHVAIFVQLLKWASQLARFFVRQDATPKQLIEGVKHNGVTEARIDTYAALHVQVLLRTYRGKPRNESVGIRRQDRIVDQRRP